MTIKEKLTELAQLKAEKTTVENRIKELQDEVLDMQEREGSYDLDWIIVKEQQNSTYSIRKELEEEFANSYKSQVKVKYTITWLSDDDKEKYFKRKLSKSFLKFEWL